MYTGEEVIKAGRDFRDGAKLPSYYTPLPLEGKGTKGIG
jgi:hypothetical protein